MYGTSHFSGNNELKSLSLSVRAYNYCISRGITTVQQLLDYYYAHNNSFPAGQNAGYYTVSELTRKCEEIIESGDNNNPPEIDLETISGWHVSVRAYNVLQSYRLITKKALLEFYRKNGNTIPDNLRNCGAKTIKEIEELCLLLIKTEEQTEETISSTDPGFDPFTVSDKSQDIIKRLNQIVNTFPILISGNKDDISFLSIYYEQSGHFPLLWLLSKYISSDDDALCFARVYGIETNEGVKSLSALAKERKVSEARIRMRVLSGQKKLFDDRSVFNSAMMGTDKDYLHNCFEENDFLSSSDRNRSLDLINKQEGTCFSNEFILKYLSVIFKDYNALGDFVRNKAHPRILVLSKDLCDNFDFVGFFSGLDAMVNDATETINLNLREYIEDSPYWTHFSIDDVERILKVAKAYALSRHGLYEENEVDCIHILPKKCDIAAIVYSIVSEAKKPITIQEIIGKAFELYPSFSFPEDVIRTALREDTRIQYIRRGASQTQFQLASKDSPISIRDAVVKFLSNSDTPLLLDDIVNYVLSIFPNSSKNSIRTSLLSDGQNRFLQFEGGRYGLSSRTYPAEFIKAADTSRMSFEERLILLKKFLDEKHLFPSLDSGDEQEVDLARWTERNQDRTEVKDLIDTYALDIWITECKRCESYIITHQGSIPPKDREPNLFKWLSGAIADYKEDRLNLEQRRLFLQLKMRIRR